VLEDGGRYCGGMEGSIDERIESVLVGIGSEVDDDGDDSNAEAYLIRSELPKMEGTYLDEMFTYTRTIFQPPS
jgi:hypothetical protein